MCFYLLFIVIIELANEVKQGRNSTDPTYPQHPLDSDSNEVLFEDISTTLGVDLKSILRPELCLVAPFFHRDGQGRGKDAAGARTSEHIEDVFHWHFLYQCSNWHAIFLLQGLVGLPLCIIL